MLNLYQFYIYIWMIGDSLLHWGAKRADLHIYMDDWGLTVALGSKEGRTKRFKKFWTWDGKHHDALVWCKEDEMARFSKLDTILSLNFYYYFFITAGVHKQVWCKSFSTTYLFKSFVTLKLLQTQLSNEFGNISCITKLLDYIFTHQCDKSLVFIH